MRNYDYDISQRVIEELLKLGSTAQEIAPKVKCTPQLVWHYLNGGIPGTIIMKRLHKAGCDILYIITGEVSRA